MKNEVTQKTVDGKVFFRFRGGRKTAVIPSKKKYTRKPKNKIFDS